VRTKSTNAWAASFSPTTAIGFSIRIVCSGTT